MKKSLLIIFILCVLVNVNYAQKLPSVHITDLQGNKVLASDLIDGKSPVVLTFWATWCKPCLQELAALNDEYADWQDETGVKIIAISIDDARSFSRVKSLSRGKDWEFDVYIDDNHNLKRALGINQVPFTCILNKKGEIVWKHSSYTPGSEQEIIEFIRKMK